MNLLFETSAGYALFDINSAKFTKAKTWKDFPQTVEDVNKWVTLKDFKDFKDTNEVLRAAVKMIHGKVGKSLQKFILKNVQQGSESPLLVGDKKYAKELSEKLGIKCLSNDNVDELIRSVRLALGDLLSNVSNEDFKNMSLGLAHGLGRFKIKFSADKIDTMIIQAVNLYQDLDKEINNYMMRLREWYGYHFPELSKIIPDNVLYAKVVQVIGIRTKSVTATIEDVVAEDIAQEVRHAAEISMGTDITEQDEEFILGLAAQVLELDGSRTKLGEYISNRMMTVAPNLSALVGEMIAAKLISKAGSLLGLAKNSASTLQILGAEKALFKAMRSKKRTPKYGIIYQTKMVGSATGRVKGKISRALAAKSALCVRFDALNEDESNEIGVKNKEYLEKRLEVLEKQEAEGGQNRGKKSFGGSNGYQNQGGNNNYSNRGDFNLKKRGNFGGRGQGNFQSKRIKS
jgi:nucleolar protein 58